MRTRILLIVIIGLAGVIFLVIPSVGGADPNLNNVNAHRHFLVVGTGESMVWLGEIGPKLCDDLDNTGLHQAFNQFHNNAHIATPGSIGQIAPGINNDEQTELVSRGCSFVPPPR
jgi:hypothetical protein